MSALTQEDLLIIPAGIVDLASFRRWTLSDNFPQRGRIDYIAGNIEVDMSPANVWKHSGLKSKLALAIGYLVESMKFGQIFIDQTRVVSPVTDLSCEPDILVVSWESLNSGRVTCAPSANPRDNLDKMEIVGAPELVVEVVSPSSVSKDTKRLPPAYFGAGVREYWIADAMKLEPQLTIYRRGKVAFEPTPRDGDGYQRSDVLQCSVRLESEPGPAKDTVVYSLSKR